MDELIRLYQRYYNISELFTRFGAIQAVLSPGSRSAVPALSCLRNPKINCITIVDERSAAYQALGIAKISQKPVILVCTSGTAAVNYAPAVTEAYFQNIPLIVCTTDRPPELLDKGENQTIFQEGIFGKHLKGFYRLPVNTDGADIEVYESLAQTLGLMTKPPFGPIQLNMPFREPFYADVEIPFSTDIPGEYKKTERNDQEVILPAKVKKTILLLGEPEPDKQMASSIAKLASKIPVLTDVLSNVQVPDAIPHHEEILLGAESTDQLKPDLVISLGKPPLSKQLKKWLRKVAPKYGHMQLASKERAWNLLNITDFQPQYSDDRSSILASLGAHKVYDEDYYAAWLNAEKRIRNYIHSEKEEFTEWHVFRNLSRLWPENSNIHIGNSLSIRHLSTHRPIQKCRISGNRGTSGIDGSLSTALGEARLCKNLYFAVLGDLSFMYDRNALWGPEIPENFRIVVFNNAGGSIFKSIPGPSSQAELKTYFESSHNYNFQATAAQHSLEYFELKATSSLEKMWSSFCEAGPALLEVKCNTAENDLFLRRLRAKWKNAFNS